MNKIIRTLLALTAPLCLVAAAFLLPASAQAAVTSYNLGGGWTATVNNPLGTTADTSLTISNIQVGSDNVTFDVTSSYGTDRYNTWGAFIDPNVITFQANSSTYVKKLIINRLTVTNKTGKAWQTFRIIKPITPNTIAALGGTFYSSPFTTGTDSSLPAGNTIGDLIASGGNLSNGATWRPGSQVLINSTGTYFAISMLAYVSTTPPPPPPPPTVQPPSAPTLSSDSNVACGGNIKINWSPVSGATGYKVYDYTGTTLITTLNGNTSTTYSRSGFTPGASIKYYVSAFNAGGESAKSTITVTASAACPVFNYSLGSSNASVLAGQSVPITITSTLLSGTTEPVTLAVSSISPSTGGITASFLTGNSCSPSSDCSRTLTVAAPTTAVPGQYVITVTGSPLGKTTQFTVTVSGGAKIVSSKVLCEKESDLPNWSYSGMAVTAQTAQNYVDSHPSCHLQSGTQFQWGYEGVGSLPGDLIGIANGPAGSNTSTGPADNQWKTSGPTNSSGVAEINISQLKGTGQIRVREVLQSGQVPFSVGQTIPPPGLQSNVSAEMWCGGDIKNYDNFDGVYSPVNGGVYYCVAFNALKPQPPVAPTLTSDSNVACGGNIKIKWNAVTGATGYKVYDYLGTTLIETLDATTLEYSHSGFTSGSDIKYHILAFNTAGESAKSSITVKASAACPVTPPGTTPPPPPPPGGGGTGTPQLSCSASPTRVTVGKPVTWLAWITPNNDDYKDKDFSWYNTKGNILEKKSKTYVQSYTATGTVTMIVSVDGLATPCTASATVISPPTFGEV